MSLGEALFRLLWYSCSKCVTAIRITAIAAVFQLPRGQQVSEIFDSVIQSFERDVLPSRFGFSARSREELMESETSEIMKRLHSGQGKLALIYDGTYIRHGKSSNNLYQRKYQNKLLPRIGSLTRIACFLNNTFGKRLKSDENLMEVIVQRMMEMRHGSNTLALEVAEKGWSRSHRQFQDDT